MLTSKNPLHDMMWNALAAAIPHGKIIIDYENAIDGLFVDIYLLRCVSRKLRQIVNAYNARIGFIFNIGEVPISGGYYTPETYWNSVHNGGCSRHCVCRRETRYSLFKIQASH